MKFSVCGVAAVVLSVWAFACSSDSERSASEPEEAPTWHQDIAPLVIQKCGSCHYDGGVAPFSVMSYEDARPWAASMARAVETGAMPPFLAQETDACEPKLGWTNDLRLSGAEKSLIGEWARAEAPEGDEDTAAEIERPAVAEIEREDVVIRLPEPVTVDGDRDIHRCLVIDPGFDEDVYVVSRHVTPGNTKVLHHVAVYILLPGANEDGTPRTKAEVEQLVRDEKGVGIGGSYDCFGGVGISALVPEMLTPWAPGALPNRAPPNSGQPIDKDSLLVMDLHYHPTGAPEVDADTELALMLADEEPEYVSRSFLLGNFEERLESEAGVGVLLPQPGEEAASFHIPAGASNHVEEMTFTFALPEGFEFWIYGAATHMHYVGRDMRVYLTDADTGEEQCLIQTPAWNFNWQRGYRYAAEALAELPSLGNGDTLRLHCIYDNSLSNPFVAQALNEIGLEAPVDVELGEDTLDEMCVAGLGLMYPRVPVP